MKKRFFSIAIFALIMTGLISSANAFAGAQTIKQRMIGRLPVIVSLKKQGAIGENSKGFLEFVGSQRAKQDVVEAENADRRQVYQAIAKQQGSTAEAVGARRALQISKSADPGDWLQKPDGAWYQK